MQNYNEIKNRLDQKLMDRSNRILKWDLDIYLPGNSYLIGKSRSTKLEENHIL